MVYSNDGYKVNIDDSITEKKVFSIWTMGFEIGSGAEKKWALFNTVSTVRYGWGLLLNGRQTEVDQENA